MDDGSERVWWINRAHGVDGPYAGPEVIEAINAQSVLATTLVCRGHAGRWVEASVAFAEQFPPPPPAATPPPPPAPPAPPSAAHVPSGPTLPPPKNLATPVDVGLSVFLSVITASIWWLVWLYPRLPWYSQNSGRPVGNRVTYFWLYVGLGAAGVAAFLIGPFLTIPLFIASAVIGTLLVLELARDQEAIFASAGVVPLAPRPLYGPVVDINKDAGAPTAAIAPPATTTTLVVLFAVANGLAATILLWPIAIVVEIFFFLLFFRNHNAIAGIVTGRAQA